LSSDFYENQILSLWQTYGKVEQNWSFFRSQTKMTLSLFK